MRHRSFILAFSAPLLFVACAGASNKPPEPPHSEPLSANQHKAEAERHERVASTQERKYDPNAGGDEAPMRCIDQPVADLTIGGERVNVMQPCWTADKNPTKRHKELAIWHRNAARKHREQARDLAKAEQQHCAGLGEHAIVVGAFFHKDDIRRVTAIKERGKIVGARVVFVPVEGLSVAWLNRVVSCSAARAAALGYRTDFMPYSPVAVGPSKLAVHKTAEGFEIEIRADGDVLPQAILGRAQDLLKADENSDPIPSP